MTAEITFVLEHEQDTMQLAQLLAQSVTSGLVFLMGDLGAGKTTLTRYWLQAIGHQGAVKSPTYTLVEPYQIGSRSVFHFDLYRLQDPYELELMGIRDYLEQQQSLFIVEWPSKGEGVLPEPDLTINIVVENELRDVRISGLAALVKQIEVIRHAD